MKPISFVLNFIFLLFILYLAFSCKDNNPFHPKFEIKAVSNLIASQDGEWIRLNWSPSSDIKSKIEIERKTGSTNYKIITTIQDVKKTTFLDTSISTDIEYTYRICGYSDENKSKYSPEAKAISKFPAPYNLQYTSLSDISLKLTWEDSCTFEKGYEIERKLASENNWQIISKVDSNKTEFLDADLQYRLDYEYRVRAYTKKNYSKYSSMLTAMIELLAPSNLQAEPLSDTEIKLTWEDNCNYELGFGLERKDGDIADWQQIEELKANTIEYTDQNLYNNIGYWYRIKTFTDLNESVYSTEILQSTLFPAPTLSSPEDMHIDSETKPTFRWTNMNGASAYELQIDNNMAFLNPEILDSNILNNSYTITNPFADNTYYWRVRIKDKFDSWGIWSDIWSFSINANGPMPLNPANGSWTIDNTPTFNWTDIPGAVEYHLKLDDDPYFNPPIIDQSNIINTYFMPDMPLSVSKYYLRVRAKDNAGHWGGWCSNWSFELLPSYFDVKWKFQTGRGVHHSSQSSPAIGGDGTIYVGSIDNYIYAINPDGSLKWKFQTGDEVYSSPTVGSDETIYVGSDDNYIYAINSDGNLKWKFQTLDDVYSSPAIASDGTIYVASYGYLYALNSDGSLKWEYSTNSTSSHSLAVSNDGTIYLGTSSGYIYAVNPNGNLKWEYLTGYYIESAPTIGKNGTIYIGCSNRILYAINSNGNLKWEYHPVGYGVKSSPIISSDGTIYVGYLSAEGGIYAIDPDGNRKWNYYTMGSIISSPAIGNDETIYFGSYDNYFYALYPDGSLKWRYKTDGPITSSPTISSDGTIIIASEDGYIYALKGNCTGLSNSNWPKFQHDNKNTGRVGGQ